MVVAPQTKKEAIVSFFCVCIFLLFVMLRFNRGIQVKTTLIYCMDLPVKPWCDREVYSILVSLSYAPFLSLPYLIGQSRLNNVAFILTWIIRCKFPLRRPLSSRRAQTSLYSFSPTIDSKPDNDIKERRAGS